MTTSGFVHVSEILRSMGHPPVSDFMNSELASELYCDEIVDGRGKLLHVDTTRSVSASSKDARNESAN